MTDEQIREAWAKACKSPTVSTNSDAAIEMVRALLAAGLSEGQEPIYQYTEYPNDGIWRDCSESEYDRTNPKWRRIVYTATPAPSVADAAGASDDDVRVTDAMAEVAMLAFMDERHVGLIGSLKAAIKAAIKQAKESGK